MGNVLYFCTCPNFGLCAPVGKSKKISTKEAMQFTGRYEARMDAKGRLFFPADFRRAFGEEAVRVVLRRDVFQPCLVVYPYDVWAAELQYLRSRLNRWNPEEAMLLRQFMADADVLELDANGRFIVPKHFRELCGEERHVVFLGLDDRIEIWDAALMAKPFIEGDTFARKISALLAPDRVDESAHE